MKNYFLSTCLICIISSCSSSKYFSQDYRSYLDEEGVKMEKVQYYTDKKIVLEVSESTSNTETDKKGTVKIDNNKKINIITIPKKTQGRLIQDEVIMLEVAFDQDRKTGELSTLQFYGNEGNTFYQLGYNNEWIIDSEQKHVKYGKITYRVIRGEQARLIMNNKIKSKIKKEEKKAKGVKIK